MIKPDVRMHQRHYEELRFELPQKCENRRTMSWVQQSSSSPKLQQEDHAEPAVRASLDCGLPIPARHTSKHYKLDPELQAKVDRVVSSEKIRLLSKRVQRQSMHPSCSCLTTTIPEQEHHHHHHHHHHHPQYTQQQQQQYHNNRLHHRSSQPPPPAPRHFSTLK
ncbi:hypothetical protein BDB00DRAFT_786863 [Zychaea mexicana]|uniref:uncharacterized protein n=1 Tax=Zychaea mexicana TaxID=64656 RepID=UPI0022FE3582|nr:uncharacterized protein BDB00DRAFT_786863 [Zychaea mexicana]KAI9494749.1 hypothetical protein BDB00DRAFT_786863 [Zychaea mexicana]